MPVCQVGSERRFNTGGPCGATSGRALRPRISRRCLCPCKGGKGGTRSVREQGSRTAGESVIHKRRLYVCVCGGAGELTVRFLRQEPLNSFLRMSRTDAAHGQNAASGCPRGAGGHRDRAQPATPQKCPHNSKRRCLVCLLQVREGVWGPHRGLARTLRVVCRRPRRVTAHSRAARKAETHMPCVAPVEPIRDSVPKGLCDLFFKVLTCDLLPVTYFSMGLPCDRFFKVLICDL